MENIKFYLLGACYKARFMADALFILTLVMTDNVVHVRKLEEKAKIKQEDFFVSGCNAPWFLRSYIVVKATRSFKTSHCIADEFPTLGAALIKSMKSHFWYLTEQLILLILADDNVEYNIKIEILSKLLDFQVPKQFNKEKPKDQAIRLHLFTSWKLFRELTLK